MLKVNIGFKLTNSQRRSTLDRKLSQSGCRRCLVGSLLLIRQKAKVRAPSETSKQNTKSISNSNLAMKCKKTYIEFIATQNRNLKKR